MASGTWESGQAADVDAGARTRQDARLATSIVLQAVHSLSSLKITVALFAMSIFIILVGTLAQVDKDMWDVIDLYFRAWFARIELQTFLPRSWFPNYQNVSGAFWFPGGALIGAAMVVNLIAAHTVRFQSQARGKRLLTGLILIALGVVVTGYIIVSGHNHAGLQGEPPFSWRTLWNLVKGVVAVACATSVFFAMTKPADAGAGIRRNLWWFAAALTAGISVWLFVASDSAYLGDSGMRILWQLIQSTLCGLVLLAGCALVFGKRGGIVLIHAGIGLMMFGQFFVSKYDVEEQMRIDEGQTKSYAEDIRKTELAIVESDAPDEDRVVVVPRSILLASQSPQGFTWPSRRPADVDEQGTIRHTDLPFDVQVLKYFRNADIRDVKPGDDNPATAGLGQKFIALDAKPAAGADSGGAVDLAAIYVRLTDKNTKADLGTYLVSQVSDFQNLSEKVPVGDTTYHLSLRFRRNYKPYEFTLIDVRKDDYVGTSTPRNYSSDIRLVDASRGVDREIHIWMNNPLRYAGETFYQSGYLGPPESRVETTTLSVVTNAGWMIPYVSCMIVFVGLVAHFGNTLLRYLRRRERSEDLANPRGGDTMVSPGSVQRKREDKSQRRGVPQESTQIAQPVSWWRQAAFPALIVAPFLLMLLRSMVSTNPPPEQFDLRAFGRLPVIADGRVKPMDTLARNSLRVLSNRETYRDDDNRSQPAIRWLLDVISQSEAAENHRVIRVDNLEVLDLLGLTRRKSFLYSVNELRTNAEKFERQVDQAQEDSKQHGAEKLTVFQRKLLELDRRVRTYTRVAAAFQPPRLPPLPTREEFTADRATAEQKLTQFRDAYVMFVRSIDGIQAPLAVPVKPTQDSIHQGQATWEPYSKAWAAALIDAKLMGTTPPPALQSLNEILVSYSDGKAPAFNRVVADYHSLLARERPAELQVASSFWNRLIANNFGNFYAFEEFFNQVSPFFFCWWPYLFAGVLAAASWLGASRPLRRAAYWLIVFTFAVHTVALIARIYISGRPPVTNLYSSAVFIGWAVVLFCLIWERLSRDGIATFLASALGFATLFIAHILAGDGDTFTVLQAVLDTQFWLATHVVTVTLGYAATFLAGALGIIYVARGLATSTLDKSASQSLARMVYGTTCFGLLFSFIGTVLGGLWADDSWGRFWGWDPKENGALIIVLWNALVLHARWDGMVKDRGLSVLAIGGNIVTSWSWFGVNELGVGLHSYGFTEGVLLTLLVFVVSQMIVIAAGCLPRKLWLSGSRLLGPS